MNNDNNNDKWINEWNDNDVMKMILLMKMMW